MDFVAMSLALAAASILPKKFLHKDKPTPRLSTRHTFVIFSVVTLLAASAQIATAFLLYSRPWFTGGTGNADQICPAHR